jgi:SAM-dependent methyltransferase
MKVYLSLGHTPLANAYLQESDLYGHEFKEELALQLCQSCGLSQLTKVVSPERMYKNYLYVSSTTQTFRQHFAEYAKKAKARLLRKTGPFLAVDIGSNDGLLLSCYQNEGMRAVGVEPARNLSREANEKGLRTVNDYFGEKPAGAILKEFGPADIISANNVFAHIDDIHSVCRGVNKLLAPGGFFVIEFPYLSVMFDDMVFDMIYHEHLSYIAVNPLKFVLGKFDLEIFAIENVSSHGGSLRVFIQKKNGGHAVSKEVEALSNDEKKRGYDSFQVYQDFAKRVYKVKEDLIGFVQKIKSEGKSISGYGAPAKGNTLINFCGLRPSQIDYIVDDNPMKQNLLSPGAHIPVVSSTTLMARPTNYVIIFAWNFAGEIIKKLEPLKKQGVQFIVPLPRPRMV